MHRSDKYGKADAQWKPIGHYEWSDCQICLSTTINKDRKDLTAKDVEQIALVVCTFFNQMENDFAILERFTNSFHAAESEKLDIEIDTYPPVHSVESMDSQMKSIRIGADGNPLLTPTSYEVLQAEDRALAPYKKLPFKISKDPGTGK